jgi:putative endonuclease
MPARRRRPAREATPLAPSFAYVLACRTPKGALTYVGWTLDPDRRLAEHNSGKGAKSTRGRVWVIIHLERLETRRDAMQREWHLKRDRKLRKQLLDAWLGQRGVPA